jgi:hypothetical protein
MKRVLGAAAGLVLLVAGLAGCDDINTVSRPGQPVVMTGADLPALVGATPNRIVAFAHSRPGGTPTWTQIPVQVDERKVVPFGTQPSSNSSAGVDGTVYGSGSGGPTALQYADPNTFVGADTNTAFDADDELVFMVSDAGGKVRAGEGTNPPGTVAGTGVAVQVDDPQGEDQQGWVYLFRSTPNLDPSAGRDYVDYDFTLTSGAYKTTYKRAVGPNPETSTVTTPTYRISFTDRWYETAWRIDAGGATGADILDGHKNQFFIDNCGRSNKTFADAEGAFVANIDGPVRAIRSYIGANSGPKTQRTHIMYRDMEQVVTDLRVHAIPGMLDFIDYSPAASGMRYQSSALPAGVTIDGVQDSVPATVPTWESVSGAQGTVVTAVRVTTSYGTPTTTQLYRDQVSPPETQCWGDPSFYGASGGTITSAIPNTDPAASPVATLKGVRTNHFLAPGSDAAGVAAIAEVLAADVDAPLAVSTTPFAP